MGQRMGGGRGVVVVAVGAACLGGASRAAAQAVTFGPVAYLCASDSPFAACAGDLVVLTGEAGAAQAAGVAITNAGGSAAQVISGGIVDSVDCDDGAINGQSCNASSYFTCPAEIRVTFDPAVLGYLPRRAGIVWTDGNGVVTARAFDGAGVLVGTITGGSADGSFGCGTAEDRFYGFAYEGGIGRLTIGDQNNCIEVDHIQYSASLGGDEVGSIDFDGDGDEGTDADIEAFFVVLAGGVCPTGTCGSIDFDGDGDEGTDADIEAFFRKLAGGGC